MLFIYLTLFLPCLDIKWTKKKINIMWWSELNILILFCVFLKDFHICNFDFVFQLQQKNFIVNKYIN